MNYTVNAAYLDFGFGAIMYDISETCTVLVLYAVYVVLSLFALYTIIHRNSSGQRFMLVTSAGIFLLGTTGMVLRVLSTAINIPLFKVSIQGDTVRAERLSLAWNRLAAASDIRLVTNKSVVNTCIFLPADEQQIDPQLYRCYMIWGSRKAVLILPGISIVATCTVGYFNVASNDFFNQLPWLDNRVSFAVSGATNVILTCLTVGRICYSRVSHMEYSRME
ncbi:hypothetical protein C8R45DRAFT_1112700 [Mycena sanguinolenta]|nr:hypothetical protein C8R45DRAFT_1112700 [Mycena sanguinolenta]